MVAIAGARRFLALSPSNPEARAGVQSTEVPQHLAPSLPSFHVESEELSTVSHGDHDFDDVSQKGSNPGLSQDLFRGI